MTCVIILNDVTLF